MSNVYNVIICALACIISKAFAASTNQTTTNSTYFYDLCAQQTFLSADPSTSACTLDGLNIQNISMPILLNTNGYNITINNCSLTYDA